jgi:hypothetical protein
MSVLQSFESFTAQYQPPRAIVKLARNVADTRYEVVAFSALPSRPPAPARRSRLIPVPRRSPRRLR